MVGMRTLSKQIQMYFWFGHYKICTYVSTNGDICEGGGYLLWSQYVECQENIAAKVIVIVTGVIFMLILFVMISSTADDFFSPSVSAIVAHLKISESIAGVTFMAFGNGAPDIFGSIASVLSSPMPKAGLALGELLDEQVNGQMHDVQRKRELQGTRRQKRKESAGVFVTTMVTATIVLTKPFKVDIYATFRDLIFYLIALGWILFVFLYGTQVFIWEPCGISMLLRFQD
uniref:Na_Ca_ex domain-containing protein n=1 Tax=Heterorhabditis bacteriophora TaxID=37862 RepID=A0A1I7XQ20_HETBA